MKTRFAFAFLTLGLRAAPGLPAEDLISTARHANGEPVPYILNEWIRRGG